MKKIKLISAGLAAIMLLPAASYADHNFFFQSGKQHNFVALNAGVNQPTTLGGNSKLGTGKTAGVFGLEVGRQLSDRFAVDLDLTHYTKSTASNGLFDHKDDSSWSTKSTALFVNAKVNLIDPAVMTPFVKLGVGVSENKAANFVHIKEIENIKNTTTYLGNKKKSFAWQAGAGLNIKSSEKFDVQLQYMYTTLGDAKTKANPDSLVHSTNTLTPSTKPAIKAKLHSHAFTVGIKYKF